MRIQKISTENAQRRKIEFERGGKRNQLKAADGSGEVKGRTVKCKRMGQILASGLLLVEARETGAEASRQQPGKVRSRGNLKTLEIKGLLAFQSEPDARRFGTGNRVQEKGRK